MQFEGLKWTPAYLRDNSHTHIKGQCHLQGDAGEIGGGLKLNVIKNYLYQSGNGSSLSSRNLGWIGSINQ